MTGHLLQVFGECCWPVLYEWQCLHRNNSLGGPYDMDMCGDCTPANAFLRRRISWLHVQSAYPPLICSAATH
ncbi:hypothetical protein TYRP_020367 [Tyrophagus putrescentiae]|nr:hypothetical protein TYRP_020367 [Tyrophagus putrescentiae]